MNKLDTITMLDLIPPNFKNRPEIIAASSAISAEYQRIYRLTPRSLVFANIPNLPESWLDLLALDMHVDYYDTELPIEAKRELVERSIPMHRKKGTPWAVEELVRIVFGEGHIEEWFEYGGQPYHFRVYTTNQLLTLEAGKKFRAALESAKNIRSCLDEIIIVRTWETLYDNYDTWENVYNAFDTWQDVLGSL